MRIIIGDTSCVIDLEKVGLLDRLFGLPGHSVAIPDIMFADELQTFDAQRKNRLQELGLEVRGLDGEAVAEVMAVRRRHPKLSVHDAAALVLTAVTPDALLLTGDANLRAVAERDTGVEVRGVLWASDQFEANGLATVSELLAAYQSWYDDDLVRLPASELRQRIRRLSLTG